MILLSQRAYMWYKILYTHTCQNFLTNKFRFLIRRWQQADFHWPLTYKIATWVALKNNTLCMQLVLCSCLLIYSWWKTLHSWRIFGIFQDLQDPVGSLQQPGKSLKILRKFHKIFFWLYGRILEDPYDSRILKNPMRFFHQPCLQPLDHNPPSKDHFSQSPWWLKCWSWQLNWNWSRQTGDQN